MNKEELHDFIEKKQPNICQTAAIRDKKIVYSDSWNGYKKDDCTHIMSATKSIMSSERIEEMTRPRAIDGKSFRGMEYGYLWWIIDRKKNIYAAIGNSGNVIYIDTEKNIVIAVSSYFKPTVIDRVDFIREYIESFVCML